MSHSTIYPHYFNSSNFTSQLPNVLSACVCVSVCGVGIHTGGQQQSPSMYHAPHRYACPYKALLFHSAPFPISLSLSLPFFHPSTSWLYLHSLVAISSSHSYLCTPSQLSQLLSLICILIYNEKSQFMLIHHFSLKMSFYLLPFVA